MPPPHPPSTPPSFLLCFPPVQASDSRRELSLREAQLEKAQLEVARLQEEVTKAEKTASVILTELQRAWAQVRGVGVW